MKARLPLRYLHKTKKRSEQKDIKELAPLLQIDSERRQPLDGTKLPGMEMVSMVIVFLVILLATRPWIACTMQEELDGTKTPGMKRVSMVIVSLARNLVIKPWTVETMQKKALEILNTLLDVGHVTKLATLLHTVIL